MGSIVTKDSEYYEKLERVFRAYESSLDMDVAMTIIPLTSQEREQMLLDADLAARISVLDAHIKEDMVMSLRVMWKESTSDGIKLAALKELGKSFYPKRFKDNINVDVTMMYKVVPRKGGEAA